MEPRELPAPRIGDAWYDAVTMRMYLWDGTEWRVSLDGPRLSRSA